MENTDKDYHRLIGRDGYFEVEGFGKVHIQSLIDPFLKDLREGKIKEHKPDLKPFDLQKALAGEPVLHKTKEGKFVPVTEIAKVGKWIVGVINESGSELFHGVCDHPNLSLFMAPKERIVWLNIYPRNVGSDNYDATRWDTEELADHGACDSKSRLGGKAHPITITE